MLEGEGTKHLQGYIHFVHQRPCKYLRDHIGQGGHYTAANGTPAENRAYCTKNPTAYPYQPVEYGTIEAIGTAN